VNKKLILLVEAEILIRHPLAEYLRDCGYRVAEAVDAKEARLVLDRGEFEFDVVLLDVSDAAGEGFALARWLRDNLPQVDVLRAGTVGGVINQASDLCRQQPDIQRPYDHKLVAERIRRLLAERAHRRQSGAASRRIA
jgi:DNA-binding response OmpR family regulator